MAFQKTFTLLAEKLALGDNEKILGKAAEYGRLLQNKSFVGTNLTDSAKIVICLDLAAMFYGHDLDVKTAVKYSGLKTPSYTASRKMIENMLELNTEKLTVDTLCLSLQCTAAQDLAKKIMEEYQRNSKMEVDWSLPQYTCMAVFHACRLNKIKVPKSKLVDKSRLKPSQWSKLDADWTKFVDAAFAAAVKKRGRPKKEVVVEDNPNPMDVDEVKTKTESPEKQESYEDWRRRMLEQAYMELKEMQGLEKVLESPRRSPRKTPHKERNSPPREGMKGVRLLFPIK